MLQELISNPLFQAMGGTAALGGVFYTLRSIPRLARMVVERFFMVTIDIHDRSAAYDWFTLHLAASDYAARARLLTAESRVEDQQVPMMAPVATPMPAQPGAFMPRTMKQYLLLSPGFGWHILWHRRRPIFFLRSRTDSKDGYQPRESYRLVTIGRSRSALDKLLREAAAKATSATTQYVTIFRHETNGESKASSVRLKRDLSSVHLTPGMKERVVADIERFLTDYAVYSRRGQPWRRGYLFHGPPGCGKTSLIFALASHFDLPLFPVHLSSIWNDGALIRAMAEAPPGAIILIEDIDAAFNADRTSRNEKSDLTFAGLLNALDGVASQEGRILVMTTNHLDRLDPALIREGRIDVREEIGPLCMESAKSLFLAFFPDDATWAASFAAPASVYKVTPAAAQGVCLKATCAESAVLAMETMSHG